MARPNFSAFLVAILSFALFGCEQLGIDDPVKVAERKESDGKAVGSGCRHSGQALVDCYALNPKISKSAIFNGWREMDGYMRENQMEIVAPQLPLGKVAAKPKAAEEPPAEAETAKAAAEPDTAKAAGAGDGKEKAADKGSGLDANEMPAAKSGKKTTLLRHDTRLT